MAFRRINRCSGGGDTFPDGKVVVLVNKQRGVISVPTFVLSMPFHKGSFKTIKLKK